MTDIWRNDNLQIYLKLSGKNNNDNLNICKNNSISYNKNKNKEIKYNKKTTIVEEPSISSNQPDNQEKEVKKLQEIISIKNEKKNVISRTSSIFDKKNSNNKSNSVVKKSDKDSKSRKSNRKYSK